LIKIKQLNIFLSLAASGDSDMSTPGLIAIIILFFLVILFCFIQHLKSTSRNKIIYKKKK